MKKNLLLAISASLLLSACGGVSGLPNGSQSSSSSNSTASIIGNILSSVIGTDKVTKDALVKEWKYNGPGCAFTSENLLAKAGGEIAASKVEEKLTDQYNKLGFTSSNTSITFKNDGTFSAVIKGKSWNGSYTYNESNAQIQMKGLLLNLNGYVKRETDGIAILFESKKLLTLIKSMSALSGSSQTAAIGDIASNYDGIRMGFKMK